MNINPSQPKIDISMPAHPKKKNVPLSQKTEKAFNELLASIEKKNLDDITSSDVKELKSLLKPRKADPTAVGKASKAVRKVMQRESKALNNSIKQPSIDKHEKNLIFFTKLTAENKEIFASYVKNLNKKSVNQMERYEIEPLLRILQLKQSSPADKESHLADNLIRKIMEREKMAFSHSYLPDSGKRHDKNIAYIDEWMLKKNVFGSNSDLKLQEYLKKLDKLAKSLSNKVLDEITSAEVNEFITIADRWYTLYTKRVEAEANEIYETLHDDFIQGGRHYHESFSLEKLDEHRRSIANIRAYDIMKMQHPMNRGKEATRQVAFTKVLLREEMALSRSHLQSSIEKHQKNIEILKKMGPKET